MASTSSSRSSAAGKAQKKHKRDRAGSVIKASTAPAESVTHSGSAAAATASPDSLAPRTASSKKRRTVSADRTLPSTVVNRVDQEHRTQLPQASAAISSSDGAQATPAGTRPSTKAARPANAPHQQRSSPAMATGLGDLAQASSHSESLRDMAGLSASAASATPKQAVNRRLQPTTSASRNEPPQHTMSSTLATAASVINDAVQVVAEDETFTEALHSCADGRVLGPMADLLLAIGKGLNAVLESISLQSLSNCGDNSGKACDMPCAYTCIIMTCACSKHRIVMNLCITLLHRYT